MDKDLINVRETARLLSVSPATIYNWVKTGKIRAHKMSDHGATMFERDQVQLIYDKIEGNQSHLLKARRNKLFVSGYSIPFDYITYQPYLKIIKMIVKWMLELSDKHLPLVEIALKLLYERGKIRINCANPGSLVLAYRDSQLVMPGYLERILRELSDVKNIDLTAHDLGVLKHLSQMEIPWVAGQDLLGLIYMSLSTVRKRKRAGSYYTPYRIAENLTTQVIECLLRNDEPQAIQELKIFDPCCGSGNFLLFSFYRFRDCLMANGLPLEDAEELILRKLLFGNDLDQTAAALAKINLILATNLNPELIPLPNITSVNTLQDGDHVPQFDIIIGNPPWGSVIAPEERRYYQQHYECSQGVCETFALFIEKSLKILKPNGYLGFVLPESFLNVSCHRLIRYKMLTSTTIQSITLRGHEFKDVAAPIITIVAQKTTPSTEWRFKITEASQCDLRQMDCLNAPSYAIVNQNLHQNQILERMLSVPHISLKDNAFFALGIVTGDNKHLISKKPLVDGELILKGKDIYRYRCKPGPNYIVFDPLKFQQVAPVELYRAPEKLIYRFINKQLVFAYDNSQVLTLNSANILIPRFKNLSIKYILAILNSRAMQYFYTTRFNSLKVLRQHLESLPIPIPEDGVQKKIIDYVNRILACNEPIIIREYYEAIDSLVMSLYNLSKDQQHQIHQIYSDVQFL